MKNDLLVLTTFDTEGNVTGSEVIAVTVVNTPEELTALLESATAGENGPN